MPPRYTARPSAETVAAPAEIRFVGESAALVQAPASCTADVGDVRLRGGSAPAGPATTVVRRSTSTIFLRIYLFQKRRKMLVDVLLLSCGVAGAVAGGRVVTAPCDASDPAQQWTFNPSSGQLRTTFGNGACAVVGTPGTDTQIVLAPCTGSDWKLQAPVHPVEPAATWLVSTHSPQGIKILSASPSCHRRKLLGSLLPCHLHDERSCPGRVTLSCRWHGSSQCMSPSCQGNVTAANNFIAD